MNTLQILKPTRNFLSAEFIVSWETIQPYFENLLQRELNDVAKLENWLKDRSELESFLEEDFAWRYIRMTCDTSNEMYSKAFEYFATEIEPKLAEFTNKLNQKFLACSYLDSLDEETYFIYIRSLRNQFELFREENIPLFTQLQIEQQNYGNIVSQMTILINNKEFTLEQAGTFLKDQNRDLRKEVYEKIQGRRLQDKESLNNLFNKLVELRNQVALNAGFSNYRDYMFKALGRFDYNAEDCMAFHAAIASEVLPVLFELAEKRKQIMNLKHLLPFDTEVDVSGLPALKPFNGPTDLMDKTIQCFTNLSPVLGEYLAKMKANNLIDLESRKGKAPGGYNYPLAETGAPFIFMNSADSVRDLTTMVHEGGHAIHTFVSSHLTLNDFKHVPSEVAEVASMSMELISMAHWDIFFENSEDLNRAKEEQLKDVIKTLPWVACIDAFQHWIYTNPNHTEEERTANWESIFDRFGANFVEWEGYAEQKKNLWQKQLHLFEVPFYYIEYAIAQLGAIALYRNFKNNPEQALKDYISALELGYTKSIKEIYATANIKFDFSASYIRELILFIKEELKLVAKN